MPCVPGVSSLSAEWAGAGLTTGAHGRCRLHARLFPLSLLCHLIASPGNPSRLRLHQIVCLSAHGWSSWGLVCCSSEQRISVAIRRHLAGAEVSAEVPKATSLVVTGSSVPGTGQVMRAEGLDRDEGAEGAKGREHAVSPRRTLFVVLCCAAAPSITNIATLSLSIIDYCAICQNARCRGAKLCASRADRECCA